MTTVDFKNSILNTVNIYNHRIEAIAMFLLLKGGSFISRDHQYLVLFAIKSWNNYYFILPHLYWTILLVKTKLY